MFRPASVLFKCALHSHFVGWIAPGFSRARPALEVILTFLLFLILLAKTVARCIASKNGFMQRENEAALDQFKENVETPQKVCSKAFWITFLENGLHLAADELRRSRSARVG